MKTRLPIYLIIFAALALGACTTDTPTQAADNANDAIAEMIAGSIGVQSNGFVAMLSNLAATKANDSIGQNNDNAPVSTTTNDVNDGNHSDQQLTTRLHRSGTEIEANATTDGIFRNSRQRMEGKARGEFSLIRVEGESDTFIARGEYRYDGQSILRIPDNGLYTQVVVTLNWNQLSVVHTADGKLQGIQGQSDVNISANGPQGLLSQNGRIVFNGTDHAILTIGGKRFILDMKSAEYIGRS